MSSNLLSLRPGQLWIDRGETWIIMIDSVDDAACWYRTVWSNNSWSNNSYDQLAERYWAGWNTSNWISSGWRLLADA